MTSGNFKVQDCDMDASFGESTPSHKTFCSSTSSNDAADFECNICFELAREPIVTLCGHLFCWPCLYKWLNIHSYSPECPVCKALVQEKKLVPLYGRGKTLSDLRSRSIPGNDIPNRPAGQRPRTAPHPRANHFPQRLGFWLLGGIMPMASVRIGGLALSTALSGLIPSLFNLQVHGFHDFTVYGTFSGFPYGFHNTYRGGPAHGFHERLRQQQQSDSSLVKMCLLLFGVLTIIYVIL